MNVRNSVPPTTAAWLGLQRLIKKCGGESFLDPWGEDKYVYF